MWPQIYRSMSVHKTVAVHYWCQVLKRHFFSNKSIDTHGHSQFFQQFLKVIDLIGWALPYDSITVGIHPKHTSYQSCLFIFVRLSGIWKTAYRKCDRDLYRLSFNILIKIKKKKKGLFLFPPKSNLIEKNSIYLIKQAAGSLEQ